MKHRYPAARTEAVQDVLAGVSFPDPYRWLEAETAEVHAWQQAQSALARDDIRAWPGYASLHGLVAKLHFDRFVSLPRRAGAFWFRLHVPDGATQAQVLVAPTPMGDGRVLFDPRDENEASPPFVSWIAPSPDGKLLALGLCSDGSENNTIHLIEVETGRQLADPPPQLVMDSWTGGVQWLADSSGFFFSALAGTAIEFDQRVYLHRRGATCTTQEVDIPWRSKGDYRLVLVARDGRHAVALERLQNPVPVAVARLDEGELRWRPFVTLPQGTLAGCISGDRYVAITDIDAPRGRVVAISLDADDPDDTQAWQVLVPESDAVLRTLTPVGDLLYLTEFVDTYARVRVIDQGGAPRGAVPLPEPGAIISEMSFLMMNLLPKGDPDSFLFGFSSFTSSPGIYRHKPGADGIATIDPPKVRLEGCAVEDCWASSSDGARIPYHVVRRAEFDGRRPQPTLIHAYGGFNVARVPHFPGAMAAFVEAGGVFVHAHIRGGGEFGLDWWQGGRMRHKQNCYDDIYAVAEDLIAKGTTQPSRLAVSGASNGGLMAGVVAMQRPDLWAAAIPRVPLLDVVGACRDPYGRHVVAEEFADIDDPDEVRRLASFSPYHLVRDGMRHPAIYLDAGATDPRCPPWHARKFAARLQAASAGGAPVLLQVWGNAGHGGATARDVAIAQHADWLAFTLRALGCRPDPVPRAEDS